VYSSTLLLHKQIYPQKSFAKVHQVIISSSLKKRNGHLDKLGDRGRRLDDRKKVGIPLKRFLGNSTVLKAAENPTKTLF
jgi:hypothetical protein